MGCAEGAGEDKAGRFALRSSRMLVETAVCAFYMVE